MNKNFNSLVCVFLLSVSSHVFSQQDICNGDPTCAVSGTINTCTQMWTYTLATDTIPGGYNNTVTSATGGATNCTVMGNQTTRTFNAQRPTGAQVTGACNFAGNFNFGGGTNSYVCTIDESGGLPVELMEYSVEDEDS